MITIEISSVLREICPEIMLGCVQADVEVQRYIPELWEEINRISAELRERLALDQISQQGRIRAAREVYRKLGKDPTRYRLASEALIRRLLKGMELYQVNNVVDINNLISLSSFYALGTYDLDRIGEKIVFRPGIEGESYEGIGRGMLNLENLPLFADVQGSFGSPTSDSERSMVTENTRRILLNIISFNGDDGVSELMEYAVELLACYAKGRNFQRMMVK